MFSQNSLTVFLIICEFFFITTEAAGLNPIKPVTSYPSTSASKDTKQLSKLQSGQLSFGSRIDKSCSIKISRQTNYNTLRVISAKQDDKNKLKSSTSNIIKHSEATYTAAVVELNPATNAQTTNGSIENVNQAIEILESNDLNGVDILVFPESVLNQRNVPVLLPNTKKLFCDDPTVDPILRNISCAVRKANVYTVIQLYVKVKCEEDDQGFCKNGRDDTNLYNMAIVFDRRGDVIAKYRKFYLFSERYVQHSVQPDLTTFTTDFNVTFGLCICFDLLFKDPMKTLIDRGVKNFIYPTYWIYGLPYLTAVQFQQSWSYANNVNLLAANANAPKAKCSGSGIYAGRLGALNVVVSEKPTTNILIANVPINLPPNDERMIDTQSEKEESINELSNQEDDDKYKDKRQNNLSNFTVEFLDFSKSLRQKGSVHNNGIYCNYDIEVSDMGAQQENTSYFYAVAVFNGQHDLRNKEKMKDGQEVCSVIACTEMNSIESCGQHIPMSTFQQRYKFKKLNLDTKLPISSMSIMPNTVTQDLLPLKANEFDYKISKVTEENKYAVALHLKQPNANIVTFAIFARNFDNDVAPIYRFQLRFARRKSTVRMHT